MLRNMYLSNKYGDMVDELKSDTKEMGTYKKCILFN